MAGAGNGAGAGGFASSMALGSNTGGTDVDPGGCAGSASGAGGGVGVGDGSRDGTRAEVAVEVGVGIGHAMPDAQDHEFENELGEPMPNIEKSSINATAPSTTLSASTSTLHSIGPPTPSYQKATSKLPSLSSQHHPPQSPCPRSMHLSDRLSSPLPPLRPCPSP